MSSGREPIRTCIGCHQKKAKKELLRIVLGSDGRICLEEKAGMPGRGAYLCDERACLQKLKKTHALERTFRRAFGEDSYTRLEEQFDRRKTD